MNSANKTSAMIAMLAIGISEANAQRVIDRAGQIVIKGDAAVADAPADTTKGKKKTRTLEHLAGDKKGKKEELDSDEAAMLVKHGHAKYEDDTDEDTKKAVELFKAVADQDGTARESKMKQWVIDTLNKVVKGRKSTVEVGADLSEPTGGFTSFGEFARAVQKKACGKGTDPRLEKMAKAQVTKADGMDESTLADGGALVPVEYSNQLYRDVMEESVLFNRCRQYPINTGFSMYVPVRQFTTYGAGASVGGSLGAWLGADGSTITAKKPVYKNVLMSLNRWGTLLPVTEELLLDNNVALGNHIFQEGSMALAYDLNGTFINGTGTGQPQGILASGSLVTATADTAQGAGSITFNDILKMKVALWTPLAGDYSSVVWLAHPDAEIYFSQMKDAAGRNLYYAAGTIQQDPTPRLLGIPVVFNYQCQPPGTPGDIILADMSQYLVSVKAGEGVRQAMSMHLYFAEAEMAYRMIYRVDGKTARTSPLAITGSAQARSGFVVLSARTS